METAEKYAPLSLTGYQRLSGLYHHIDTQKSLEYAQKSVEIYLALAWNELYFGDIEKAGYYMDKFVNEGEWIDKEINDWINDKKLMLENICNKKKQ